MWGLTLPLGTLAPSTSISEALTPGIGVLSTWGKSPQESSPAPQLECISSSALNLLYVPTLTSVHDYMYGSFSHLHLSLFLRLNQTFST